MDASRPLSHGATAVSSIPDPQRSVITRSDTTPICRFFNSPTGCRKEPCRFQHVLTDAATAQSLQQGNDSSKSSIPCKFYSAGYCRRGENCWFSHDASLGSVASANADGRSIGISATATSFTPMASHHVYGANNAEASSSLTASPSQAAAVLQPAEAEEELEPCGICMDQADVYGLLENCDHTFCFKCLREWRSSQQRNPNLNSGVTKQCPTCRTLSFFITPSSRPYRGEMKRRTIERYKANMSKKPCKHFERTKDTPSGPFCPFGDDCHYAHQLSATEDRYMFNCGAAQMLEARRDRHGRPSSTRAARRFYEFGGSGEGPPGSLSGLRYALQDIIGAFEDIREERGWGFGTFNIEDDFYDQGDIWGLDDEIDEVALHELGYSSNPFDLPGVMETLEVEEDYGIDWEDEDDDFEGENYFDQDDGGDYEDAYEGDVFGLRRAFEEGYARADEAGSEDGEVHSFSREGGQTFGAIWEEGEDEDGSETAEEVPDQWDAEQEATNTSVDRDWRSSAPSPASSLEERIWEIRNEQMRQLHPSSFDQAETFWDEPPQDQDLMRDMIEAARRSLGLDSIDDLPPDIEQSFRINSS